MLSVNNNVQSLFSQAALNKNTNLLQNLSEKLASLKKINKSSDDAAGLAIATKLHSQIRGLEAAKVNAQHGQAALQIADSSFNTITNLVQRQRELAEQGANDTLQQSEREKIVQEYEALNDEIKRIAQTSQFNNKNLIWNDGSGNKENTFGAGVSSHLQIGSNTTLSDGITVSYSAISTANIKSFAEMGATTTSYSSVDFKKAMEGCDATLKQISTARTNIGVYVNRLDFTLDNLDNMITEQSGALAAVEDLDIPKAGAEALALQMKQQSATQILSLVNQLPASLLQLLQL